jgi:hypothetical protein
MFFLIAVAAKMLWWSMGEVVPLVSRLRKFE